MQFIRHPHTLGGHIRERLRTPPDYLLKTIGDTNSAPKLPYSCLQLFYPWDDYPSVKCLYCTADALPDKACCAECLQRHQNRLAQGPRQYVIEPPTISSRLTSPPIIWGGASVMILVFLVLLSFAPPRKFNYVSIPSFFGDRDPCVGRAHCLIFYTTTWCPACHATRPFMRQSCSIINRGTKAGCKVVIGGGGQEPAQLQQFTAELVGTPVFLDADGQLAYELKGRSAVPRWYFVSAERAILESGVGGIPADGSPDVVHMIWRRHLGDDVKKLW